MTGTAVVTGIGVLAPSGIGADAHWAATLDGRCAIAPVTRFDTTPYPVTLAGEVPAFDPQEYLPDRLMPQTDPMTRLALVAADSALADADVRTQQRDEYEMGVVTGSSFGGFDFGQRELQSLWRHGGRHVSVYQSFAWFYAVNTGQLSIRHGMRGPARVLVTEQAGGLDAVGHARRQIRDGLPLALTGGADSSLCPWGWTAHMASGRLSTSRDRRRAYLPFDRRAAGYVPGEGAAFLVLEDAAAVIRRGGHGHGEIAGYAATFDPRPGGPRPPALRAAISGALADAGITPEDIDVVYADAAGLPHLDQIEAAALREVFGPHRVPVTAPKAGTGRLSSAAGPLDIATALLSIRDQTIPPTPNTSAPCPEFELDLVTGRARPAPVRTALVVARGQGGFNAAVVVRGSPTSPP